jgi:NAD kinase
LKFRICVHSKRPKIPLNEILKVVESAGVSYSNRDPDVAIVVGGDGTFGYYGKKTSDSLALRRDK